ncbi:MAG: amidohydrolase family protein [Planctomycetota bacterium]
MMLEVLLTAIAVLFPAFAQEEPPKKAEAAEKAVSEAAKPAPAEEPAEPEDVYLAIVGGDVYTVTGEYLRGATVLVCNDKIQSVGTQVKVPAKATVVQAAGMKVYPGLIAVRSSGLVGSTEPRDSTDVYSLELVLGLASGITTAVTGNTAAKLTYGTLEGMILKENLYQDLPYSRSSPDSRRKLREDLQKARAYIRDLAAWELAKKEGRAEEEEEKKEAKTEEKKGAREAPPEGEKQGKEPEAKKEEAKKKEVKPVRKVKKPSKEGVNQAYLDLLEGKTIARLRANDMAELLGVADLVSTFGFKAVIDGAYEGWTVADRLGRAGVAAIVTPRTKRTADERLNRKSGSSIENARRLWEHGVEVAIIPSGSSISLGGIAGRDLMTLPMEAAFAVRGGLPEAAAIDAITLGAARLLGIDSRVGSIEEGKDADLIICDGDLLDYRTFVQQTYVNGKLAYDKSKETLFRHIRPRDIPVIFPPEEKAPEEEALEEEGPKEPPAEEGKEKKEEAVPGAKPPEVEKGAGGKGS